MSKVEIVNPEYNLNNNQKETIQVPIKTTDDKIQEFLQLGSKYGLLLVSVLAVLGAVIFVVVRFIKML